MTFEIKQGDALSVLRGMPSESVQTCITSPPYYGLRSYGTEPQVWGNHNGCSHEWIQHIEKAKGGRNVEGNAPLTGNDKFTQADENNPRFGTKSDFCLSCNAWRGELGLEPTFQLYISHLIEIFAEVKRVLKKDGTCWVNLGDSFAGSWGNYVAPGSESAKALDKRRKDRYGTFKPSAADRNGAMGVQPKSLMNIPARFAIAMTDELKMIQRNEIIWHKPACMPSSAKDRFTVDFEKIFFFSKEPRYKFNQQLEPLAEASIQRANYSFTTDATKFNKERPDTAAGNLRNGSNPFTGENRNKRCVWDVPFEPSGNEHYASYPTKLVEPMILAGTDEGDTVLDIFSGTGTTLLTALRLNRRAIGIELQPKYVEISRRRLSEVQPVLLGL